MFRIGLTLGLLVSIAKAAAPPAAYTPTDLRLLQQRALWVAAGDQLLKQGAARRAAVAFRNVVALDLYLFGDPHPTVAHSWILLGQVYDEADDAPREIAARREAARHWQRLDGARPWLRRDAEVALRHAEQMEGLSIFQHWRLERATSLNRTAVQMHAAGRAAEAIPLARQALEIERAVLGNRSPMVAGALANLGVAARDAGEFIEARAALLEALRLRRELFGPDHPDHARSLHDYASLVQEMGDRRLARQLYHEVQALLRVDQRQEEEPYALVLNDLAVLEAEDGNFAVALPLAEEAVALQKHLLGEKSPNYANALHNVAAIHQVLGDPLRAIELADRALALMEKAHGKKHPVYAHGLMNRAALAADMNDLPLARRLYDQAAEIYRAGSQGRSLDYVRALANVAAIDRRRGDVARALPLLDQARRLALAQGGPAHQVHLACLNNLAGLYEQLDDRTRSREMYERCVALQREALGDRHPEYALGLLNLAGSYWADGRLREAQRLLGQSVGTLQRNLDDTMSTLSGRQRRERLDLLGRTVEIYLTAASGPHADAEGLYAEVLAWKGAQASRTAEERLTQDAPELRGVVDELIQTRATLAWLVRHAPAAGTAARRAWVQRLDAAEKKKEELEIRLARGSVRYRAWQAQRRASPEAIRAALPSGTALVEFVAYQHRLPGAKAHERRLLAFVVRPGQPTRLVHLGPADPVGRAIQTWREAVVTRGAPTQAQADRLRALVWEKIDRELGETRQVFVAPDAELCAMPLVALPGRRSDTYLLEDLTLVQVFSGRQLLDPPNSRATTGSLLVVGDPTLPAREKLDPLPAARLEADSIARLFRTRTPTSPRMLLGSQADRRNLLDGLAGKPRWLHLAMHAFFERDAAGQSPTAQRNPLLATGLILADTRLSAEEVASLDLRGCDLVALSACETGLGPQAGWQGVQGLQRAFHDAGAQRMLASLWRVSDAATSMLMEEFYRNLWSDRPMPPAEALRAAQLVVLRQPERIQARREEIQRTLLAAGVPDRLRGPASKAEAGPPIRPGRSNPALWAPWILSGFGFQE
ncbi:MAG: CHAT domain-containing tetratricopeptide repeat protein [Gemmataceae bacterium]